MCSTDRETLLLYSFSMRSNSVVVKTARAMLLARLSFAMTMCREMSGYKYAQVISALTTLPSVSLSMLISAAN